MILVVPKSGHRFRVEIRHDSYAFQSHSTIDKWDGAKWQRLHAIPYPQMASVLAEAKDPSLNYISAEKLDKYFDQDEAYLCRVALEIVVDQG